MKIKEFEKIIDNQIACCRETLFRKGKEYASDEEIDRLEHFKKAGSLMGTSQKAALFSMLTKHLISVSDMCMKSNEHSEELWTEKITDSINYLLILKTIVIEENKNE